MSSGALLARPIAVEVARANAVWFTDAYLRHYDVCSVAPLRRCDECERRGLDLVAAVQHRDRLVAAQLAGAEG